MAWVQDATGGVRVDRIGLDPLVHVGDVVELTGRATMGGPAPIVLRETLRVISSGPPPPPIRITAADVAEGRHQYLFVETSGIVRSRLDGFARPPGADAAHRRPGSRPSASAKSAAPIRRSTSTPASRCTASSSTNHDAYGRTGAVAAPGVVDARDHDHASGADRGGDSAC